MPRLSRLPRFYSKQQMPAESGLVAPDPGKMGVEWGAWAKAGAKFERLGLQAIDVFGRQAEAERRAAAFDRVFEITQGIEDDAGIFADSLNTRIDYKNLDKDAEAEINKWKDKYKSKLELFAGKGEDKDVVSGYNRAILKYSTDLKKVVRTKKAQLISEGIIARLSRDEDKKVDEYAEAITEDERAIIRGDFELAATVAWNVHAITEEQKDNLIKSFDEKAKKAKKEAKVRQAFMDILAEASLSPDVINNNTGQIDKALSLWSDAIAVMKKYNVTLLEWKEVLVDLSAIKTQYQAESIRVMDELSLKARALYNQRALKPDAVFNLAKNIPDFGVRDNFIKEMLALSEHQTLLAKQMRGLDAITTDPAAYAALHEKILRLSVDPLNIPALQREILTTPGIGENHRNQLIEKLYSKLDAATREMESQVKTSIRNQIISTGPLGQPIAAEYKALQKAYDALDYESNKARMAGKPWTQEQYSKYGQELADFYRLTLTEKTGEMVKEIRRTKQPLPMPKRKAGETIDQYKKRTGIQ